MNKTVDTFEAFKPAGLAVETAGPSWIGSTHHVVMTTYLFRYDACLTEAVNMTLAANPDKKELKVISAGCSYGAEADSLLSLLEMAGQRDVKLTGYDLNKLAIINALRGRHKIALDTSQQGRQAEIEAALVDCGFEVEKDHDNLLTADSNQLRSRHSVDFEVQNLTDALPVENDIDLIVASNLMFNVEEKYMKTIAGNLASVLSENGVIDFGVLSEGVLGKVDSYHGATNMLLKDFGLKPKLVGSNGHPRIFARA